MYRLRRGLGAVPTAGTSFIDTGFGIRVDCSQWGPWLLNSGCWGYAPSTWAAAAALPPPPAPPATPAVSAGTSTVPAPYQCASGAMVTAATNCPEYSAAIDAAAAAQSEAQKAGAQAFFEGLPENPAGPPDCGTFQTLSVDSSGNQVCVLGWLGWAAVGLVGLFGLVAIADLGAISPRRYRR